MGIIESERNERCNTCNCHPNDCPGHFGYISLFKPVFHVGYIKECVKILQKVCKKCSRLLNRDQKTKDKFKKKKDKSKKTKDKFIECVHCKEKNYNYKKDGLKIYEVFDEKNNNKVEIKPEQVYTIFQRISVEDYQHLGFNQRFNRPEWMIIKNLTVCPLATRPPVSLDSSLTSHDDLTHQYIQIYRDNEDLIRHINNNAREEVINSNFDILQKNVAALMNNNLSCTKVKISGKPIKCLFSRINGKFGRIRQNLMGKRVDFCARTVISPDPNLDVDEIGIPLPIAINLTFPEEVTYLNKEFLQDLVWNGIYRYPGAKQVTNKKGTFNLKFAKNIKLEIGDIVERNVLDGDYIIFNRQPSLHKMSMMGHRVKIFDGNLTFRLNLSVTTPYNADFDGDEMNLHLPQSIEAKAEIMKIAHVPQQVISPRTNKPIMGIVQDSLLGCKLFTSRDTFLTYEQTMSIIMNIDDFTEEDLPMPCILKPNLLWSGKQIFSLILPKKLNFKRIRDDNSRDFIKNNNSNDDLVEIRKGKLLQGIICSKSVGSSSGGGIAHLIWLEEGPKSCIKFLGLCQKIINNYLLLTGFSIGISDISISKDITNSARKKIEKLKNDIEKDFNNNELDYQKLENKANKSLNSALSIAGKEVKDSLTSKNNFNNMVSSGSKGKITNISQIIACVGQQNVDGKRIPFKFKKRTLPHFLENDYDVESRGFIENSYIKGLTPQEFFFHAMAGREGTIDTSIKTSETGYTQRRLMKLLEDLMINYDGTVRNSTGNIIQFIYGEDGMAAEYIEDQEFEILNMDDNTLIKNYKLLENGNDNDKINYLSQYLEGAVIDIIRNQIDQLSQLSDDEFEQIKNDRDDMKKGIFKNNEVDDMEKDVLNNNDKDDKKKDDLNNNDRNDKKKKILNDNSIHIPININRIITNAKTRYRISPFSKSNLNPFDINRDLIALKNELKIIKGNDTISRECQNNAMYLLNAVLNYSLSMKNLIIKHRINKDAFKEICSNIKKRFYKSLACPGEMVGSIAAQSIGEPISQMTLNTFHMAGVSSLNVTLGIPRLKEIMNYSKNIKTPSMSVYLKSDVQLNNQEFMDRLIRKIENIHFYDIIDNYKIYKDPNIYNSIIAEDTKMIDQYMEIQREYVKNIEEILSPYALRLEFNKEKMINIRMKTIVDIISSKLAKDDGLIIADYEDHSKMIIRFINKKRKPKNRPKEMEEKEEEIKNLEKDEKEKTVKFKNSLFKISISGIDNIKKVNLIKVNSKKIPYYFETEGTNLLGLFNIDEIDFKRTISNDIDDIYKTLGIEAARHVLIKEIKKVLAPYDVYINYRHLSLLSDLMTNRGYIISITRHGLKKISYSPIKNSTFEMMSQILLEAGKMSQRDLIKGVSEKILVGNPTDIGTSCFKIINLDGRLNANGNYSDYENNSDYSSSFDGRKYNPISYQIERNPYSSSQLREDKEENNSDDNSNSSPGFSNARFRENIQGININDTSPQMNNQRYEPMYIPNNQNINESPKIHNNNSYKKNYDKSEDDEEEEEDDE